jgi:excinuclease UvrABC helicase subunit UvrB
LTTTFKKKIKDSSKLKELDPTETPLHFLSIEDLKDYYNSLISEQEKKPSKSRDDLHKELLKKIKDAIDIENYEEAARLRDYMIKNNFKKN